MNGKATTAQHKQAGRQASKQANAVITEINQQSRARHDAGQAKSNVVVIYCENNIRVAASNNSAGKE